MFIQVRCVSIIMYADDNVLLSPSVTALQELLHVCEGVLQNLDLFINPKKSVYMRIGPEIDTSSCQRLKTYLFQKSFPDVLL